MLIIVKMSEMIHHAFLRNQDERTNSMPSIYDIFDITSLEKKKLIELISSSSIWHEKLEAVMKITPQHLRITHIFWRTRNG